ncbi:hypothetical protein T03_3202 [Trichinella britovi]|uniref:Uncharacterized protein n=1 Tax=Trichinella britovi TaxID=45882 RepID=A0A0V1D0U5_TRIBR|nr:hypothetical protein T03_3202 [Trichinella britovi]
MAVDVEPVRFRCSELPVLENIAQASLNAVQ